MPNSAGSQDSHPSVADSLPSLSDHDSIKSAASSHSSLASHSAYWANPPDTYSLPLAGHSAYYKKDSSMHTQHQQQQQNEDNIRASGPHRSSTIKANKPGFSSSRSSVATPAHSSEASLGAMDEPISSITASSSQPVLHSLVLPSSSTRRDNNSGESSKPKLNDVHLPLDEAAPRLSMSSTGSASTCELATPENVHQSWPYDDVDGSALAALQSSASSSSQALNETIHAPSPVLVAEVELRPPSRELDATSSSLDRLAIQRPAKLERLSSAVTNATAKGSTRSDESPQTATQSPRSFQVSDLSSLRIASAAETDASASSAQLAKSPSLETDIPSRANMTSPDSWRSLLPEHDPYFASEGQLRALQNLRSASPQNLHPSSGAFDIDTYVAAKTSPRTSTNDRMSISSFDTARTSFSSEPASA